MMFYGPINSTMHFLEYLFHIVQCFALRSSHYWALLRSSIRFNITRHHHFTFILLLSIFFFSFLFLFVGFYFISQNTVKHWDFFLLCGDKYAQTCFRSRIVAIITVVFIIAVVVYDADYIHSHYGFVLCIIVMKIRWLSYSKYHPSGVITLIIISKCLRFCWGLDVFLAVARFVSFTSLHHRNYHPFCCSQLRGDTTQRYAKYIFHFAGAHWLFDIDNAHTVHPTHRNATQMSLEVRFWWRKK